MPEGASADERLLVEKFCRHGDESAFRTLYRRQTPLLYRVAYRMVANADRAADIVQDTWLRAAQRLPSFRWQSSLATWLVGIVVNRSREETRRKTNEALAQDELPEPAARKSDPWQRLDLERAVAQLPEGYREILLLHDSKVIHMKRLLKRLRSRLQLPAASLRERVPRCVQA